MKQTAAKTVDEYIAGFEGEVRENLERIRAEIKRQAPGAEESISYGMPGYKLHKKPLVYFAAQKKHYGFYPTPDGIESFREELVGYETTKGAIRFPMADPLPLELISRIVAMRIKEVGDEQ